MKRLKIKKIEKVESDSLNYDIQVEDTENFFANNILVHNCTVLKDSDANFKVCSRNQEKKMYLESFEGLVPGIAEYNDLAIGDKVKRKDKKEFKSGLVENTVKKIIDNGKFLAITFEEDNDSVHIRALGQHGYFDKDRNFYTQEEAENSDFTKIQVLSTNKHVVLSQPVLEKLKNQDKALCIRGEIYGKGLGGSGNSNNPHKDSEPSLSIYGIDDYSTGIAIPLPMKEVEKLLVDLDLMDMYVPVIYKGIINNYDELVSISENYFKDNLVEGIVWRTFNDTKISTKYMNLEYDAKK